MSTIWQQFIQEAGGWTVLTSVDGVLRRQAWTLGSKRDANALAKQERAAVSAPAEATPKA